jgi:hypothetical protein
MGLSPAWAFSGQAIDAVGDAHLAPGMHYRVLTSPLLGLPVVPLVIGKVRLGTMAKGFTRRDVTWVDSRGTILTTPFIVTPDNPVTGHLPAGEVCCWAALEGRAISTGPGPLPFPLPGRLPVAVDRPASPPVPDQGDAVRPGVVRPGLVRPVVVQPAVVPPQLGPGVIDVREIPGRFRQARFWVEGVVGTAYGDAPVAVRSSAPYHVYASHLERIVVHGSGTVTGLSWLPAGAVQKAENFRTAPLPTISGARYSGPADGRDQGFDRVKRGAPQRFGMHESPLAAAPTACAPVGAADEVDRIEKLTIHAATTLDRLINDTSAPQRLLKAIETVLDVNGAALGTTERFVLMDLLLGVVDPGVARWLGFLDVDEDVADKEVVVAYVVDALFAPDWDSMREERLDLTVPQDSIVEDGVGALLEMAKRAPELEKFADGVRQMGRGPFAVQRVVLAATANVPLDPPSAPALATPVSGDWLPALPPTAAREITVGMEGLVPGAGLASALAQPNGAKPVERNPEDSIGRRVLLTPRPDAAAITATSGVLADRQVDEQDGSWQIAELDWFGRWSSWAARTFGPATRPRPPRPVLTLTTQPPAVPTPPPTGPLAGVVRIEVSVPPVSGLPSGGRLLQHLALTVTTSGAGSVTTIHPVAMPSAPPEVMVIEVPGPALLPTASGPVTVTAVWTDSGNVDSDPSEPKSKTMYDPRPPAAVVIPPTLTYTARPDATGRARATLEWTPSTGQASYRVFVADETTLRAKLEDVVAGIVAAGDAGQAPTSGQAQALLAALDAAADAPARGAIWNADRALLPRRWWLQLTAEPVPRPPNGPVTVTHDVSGSLTVLVMYRVVAVSEASVESDFRTSPLMPRGVPNLLVPPMPSIDVLPVVDGAGNLQAQLTVTVPVGPTPAAGYRIRRATGTSDPVLMQVVAEGVAPARPPGDPAPQVFTVIDTGSSPSGSRSSLSSWIRYIWRAEVQGAPAPGGGPVGEWSSPSAPASTVTMPPDPPVAVTDLSVTRVASAVHVLFRHPDPLAGGATPGYTIDVYRQLAGEPLRLLTSIPGQAPAPVGRGANVAGFFEVVDSDAAAVAGTLYRVVVTDPIGRASPPSAPQEAP